MHRKMNMDIVIYILNNEPYSKNYLSTLLDKAFETNNQTMANTILEVISIID